MNEQDAQHLIDRLHHAQNEFYAGGSSKAITPLLTNDVHWLVPGDNVIAGHYVGIAAVLDYFHRRRSLSGCTLRLIRREILVGHSCHLAALTHAVALRNGQLLTWQTVGLYAVRGTKISRCWLLPFDASAFDDIWL